jgi:hypothetical protein
VATPHELSGTPTPFDFGGGVRVAGNLGIGGTFTQFAEEETVTTTASATSGDTTLTASLEVPANHVDTTIHIHAVWVLALSQTLDVSVFGGPSLVWVDQDLVSGITVEQESATSAKLTEAALASRTERAFGWHVGVDGTHFLTPTVGIGAMLRYVSASVPFDATGSGSTTIDLTGLQFGMGVRLRFP